MPVEPSAQCRQRIASEPCRATKALTAAISASVSVAKWLIATTAGTPKDFTLAMCRPRLAQPLLHRRDVLGPERRPCATPPFIFSARTVATITAASGCRPALRHLMSKNFSAPRSAPKPGLGHHEVGELQRRPRRHHRVAAVGDVGERAAVHEGGVVLQRLHQVRLHRLREQHRHRAVGLEVARGAPAGGRGCRRR